MKKIELISFNANLTESNKNSVKSTVKQLFEFDAEPYGDKFQVPQDKKPKEKETKLDRQGYPLEDKNLKLYRNDEDNKFDDKYAYTLTEDMTAKKVKEKFNLEDSSLRINEIYEDGHIIKAGTTIYFYKNNVIRQYEAKFDKNGQPIADGEVLTEEIITPGKIKKFFGAKEKTKYIYRASGDESYAEIRKKFHIKDNCYTKNNGGYLGDADIDFKKNKEIIFYSEDIDTSK